MTVHTEIRTTKRRPNLVQALTLGACLQILCIALPLLDVWMIGSIEQHVQNAYPEWGPDNVNLDRNAIAGYLVIVGVLGLAGWLGALWSAKKDVAVRAVVTTLFVIGTCVLLFDVGYAGEHYDPIVPLWLGVTLLVIPLLPGITAVMAAWVLPPTERADRHD